MSASAPLLWKAAPHPGYYINTVASCADGSKVVAGTFLHSYSDDRRLGDASSGGHFGTYCWDYSGNLIWSNEYDGYEGVYWATLSANGKVAASCGWYSSSPAYQGFIATFNADNGAVLLDYFKTAARVNQVALNTDGSVLAAGADTLYVFIGRGGSFPDAPLKVALSAGDSAISVGISADGQWVAAGMYSGQVTLLQIVGGVIAASKSWTPSGNTVHSLGMADNGQGFVVGMKNGQLAYFDCAGFLSSGQPGWTQTLAGTSSVYGVAIAADGSFVSAVGNIGASGTVGVFDNNGSSAPLRWQHPLTANPNSTTIDAQGRFVGVADGHPDGTPGHFTLLNAGNGVENWSYTTGNMSWPLQLAGNAMSCVGGSDDGNVYFFAPIRLLEMS